MLGTELNQIQKIADVLSRREYGAGFYTLDVPTMKAIWGRAEVVFRFETSLEEA